MAVIATICWARTSSGLRGTRVVSISPRSIRSTTTAVSSKSPRYLGKMVPFDGSPTEWPARPIRWMPLATLVGDSTWITRSTAPMSMPSSRLEVATSPGRRPAFSASSINRRCSFAIEPWCARTRSSPASSLMAAASRSASRRELTKMMVERCWRTSSRMRGWIAGQMLRRGPSGSGPITADGPLYTSVPRSRSAMSSTGTSTVISMALMRPASPMVTARFVPPRNFAVSLSGRCVADKPIRCGSALVMAASRSRLSARWAPRFAPALERNSPTITHRIDGRTCRAALVRSRKSDSGVVIRMSGGWRSICRRSRTGVSPVRIATVMGDRAAPMRSACNQMPRRGACRLRSMSTVSALSGETANTRPRSPSAGTASVANRSMHQKKAASVLPLPVGADISVCWPAATDRQPPSWTSVGAENAPENQARAAGENMSRTVGMGLSLLPLPGRSKPERAKQVLGRQRSVGLKDRVSGLEQTSVVRRRAADPLAERDDLPVEVVELAARATPEALEGRWPIGAVRRKTAGQSGTKQAAADGKREECHRPEGPRPPALIECVSTRLRRPDALANGRDRQPCQSSVPQRLANRQAGDGHDGVVEIRHELRPAGPRDVRDVLRLHDRAEQRDDRLDPAGRLRKGRAHLQQRAGILFDHPRLEIGRTEIQDATDDAVAPEDAGRLAI